MIKVLIHGVNGKMGQEVLKQLSFYDNCALLGGFDKENTGKFSFPIYTNFNDIKDTVTKSNNSTQGCNIQERFRN